MFGCISRTEKISHQICMVKNIQQINSSGCYFISIFLILLIDQQLYRRIHCSQKDVIRRSYIISDGKQKKIRAALRYSRRRYIYWDYGVLQAAEVLESKFCIGSLLDDIQQQQNIGTIVFIANSVGTVVKVIVCPPNKVISMEVL